MRRRIEDLLPLRLTLLRNENLGDLVQRLSHYDLLESPEYREAQIQAQRQVQEYWNRVRNSETAS